MPSTLSKTLFVAGVQCHKQLWWRVHDKKARELTPDPVGRVRMEEGSEVGRVARTYVPGGTLIDIPVWHRERKVADTRRALDSGATVLYEAAFQADGVFVAVDILSRDGDGWVVTEVKSSLDPKDHQIVDAALQAYIVERSGLPVTRIEIMHLCRDCVYPDLSNLFVRADVTTQARERMAAVPSELATQIAALAGELPSVEIGPHCSEPWDCCFWDRCWPKLPDHHVSTLYKITSKKSAKLLADGYTTIADLPLELDLSVIAARQRRAVIENRMIVEGELAASLAQFCRPLVVLDFETVMPAIPRWNGCHPREQVAAQFSACRVAEDGTMTTDGWVAAGGGDPRAEIARRVVDACRGAKCVVAYSSQFERGCLEHLQRDVPELAGELQAVIDRLVDPLPVIREHVYHPAFRGSFSLKSVLPALVPGMSYCDLTIQDGQTAQAMLMELTFSAPGEREDLRAALAAYCERDSEGTARLVGALGKLGTL